MKGLAASVVVVGVLGVVGAVIVAGDDPTSVRAGSGDGDAPGAALAGEPSSGPVADALAVSCGPGGSGIELAARRVGTRPDGVLVRVVLPDDGTSVEVVRADRRRVGAPALDGVYDTGDAVLDGVGPGRALVRCYPDDGPRHMMAADEDPEAEAVEIVDADGHWREPRDLECESDLRQNLIVDYLAPSGPTGHETLTAESPLEIARDDLPVSPVDTLEVAGYAEGADRVVEVVRDGRVVISARYTQSQGTWRLGGYDACGDG